MFNSFPEIDGFLGIEWSGNFIYCHGKKEYLYKFLLKDCKISIKLRSNL